MCLINAKFCTIPDIVYVVRIQFKNQNDDWLYCSPFHAKWWQKGQKEIVDCSRDASANIIQDDGNVYSGAFHSFKTLADAKKMIVLLKCDNNSCISCRTIFEAKPGGVTGEGIVRFREGDDSWMPEGYFSTELTLIREVE